MGHYNILLVFPSARDEVVEIMISTLVNLYGNDVSVHPAQHVAGALNYLKRFKYQLIISDLNIAADGKSVLNDENYLGLDFIEKLDKDNKYRSIQKILAVPRKKVKWFEAIQKFQLTKIISYENIATLESEFKDFAQAALEDKKDTKPYLAGKKPFGNVIIELDPGNILGNDILGSFEIETEDISFHPKDKFYFNQKELSDLIEFTDDLIYFTNYDKWEGRLKKIGLGLREEIFSEKNLRFIQFFSQLKSRVVKDPEDISNISIKFIIKREFHSILFEAFVEEEPNFWMLHAPIYRGCYVDSTIKCTTPLFEKDDDTPLKCLIIQASTAGYVDDMIVDGENLTLETLPHLEKECSWLEKTFFPELKQQGRIQDVLKIEEKEGQDFYGTVLEELMKGTWNMVHYAGHSVCGEYKGVKGSFLFFPHPDGVIVKDIDQFVLHLRKLKFIYLSSCSSGGSGFVFNLAENHVPAIVGFGWDIDDKLAFEFTKTFYQHLFAKNSLETAFLETRRNMYDSNKESKIWAAPILIIQIPQC
jgi:hypothetical protein